MSHKPVKDARGKRAVFMRTRWNAVEGLDKDESLPKIKEAGKLDGKTNVKDKK